MTDAATNKASQASTASDNLSGPLLMQAVFSGRTSTSRWFTAGGSRTIAWLVAIAVHAGLFYLAMQSEPSLETWSARVAALIHEELQNTAPTTIEATPPARKAEPEPEPEPEPAAEPESPEQVPAATVEPTRAPAKAAAKASPPAQAGQIVGAAENPDAPIDLTGNTFVTGSASAFVGGVTTRSGTNTKAVSRADLSPKQPAQKATTKPSKKIPANSQARSAQPASTSSHQWQCPWPQAAMDQDIYEQSVTIRATVRADGTVANVVAVQDPGFGFAQAAIACARNVRFAPALNDVGKPITADTPPIRVRFTR